ncbi:class I SAM-dependent methyltransferase [Cytobacillus kochii]|uniref:methyltransferase domain-containing protein n=1 Tax=Cytobacillus kochii TaxID=859143 RepID=UPI001CD7BE62|nr:methyltransferase domain-containing protein [Cytobacillus kochii]MCA1028649.1 class I SAM-dependent methyltransferase [Cytobacillus kochii]
MNKILYPCDICNNEEFILFKEKKGFFGDVTSIVTCSNCSLTFLNPRVNKTIETLYEHRKFKPLQGKNKNSRLNLFAFGMSLLKSHVTKGTILDVAMNDGTFLNTLSSSDWNRYGIEDSKLAYEYCSDKFDFKSFHTNVHECNFPNNFFDVISLWDVLNRSPLPSRNITSMNRLLKEDGYFLVSFEAPTRVLFRGVNHYFTPFTFNKLLTREGYKSVEFYYIEDTGDEIYHKQKVNLNENNLKESKIGHYIAIFQKIKN